MEQTLPDLEPLDELALNHLKEGGWHIVRDEDGVRWKATRLDGEIHFTILK